MESMVVPFIRALPLALRHPLSILAFYPSVLYTRARCALTSSRRLWDRVHPRILLGSAPVLRSDVQRLREQGATCIINCCSEWGGDPKYYESVGLRFEHVPTEDFDPPPWRELLRAAEVVREVLRGGGTVYIHCKAGRGRSVFVALAYLVLHEGMTARAADALLRAQRPHISRKWDSPEMRAVEELARASQHGGAGSRGSGAPAFLQGGSSSEQQPQVERLALRSLGGAAGAGAAED